MLGYILQQYPQVTRLFYLTLAAIIIVLLLYFREFRGIVVPLRGAVSVARKVASGNLTSVIEVRSRDETGELMQAAYVSTVRWLEAGAPSAVHLLKPHVH